MLVTQRGVFDTACDILIQLSQYDPWLYDSLDIQDDVENFQV
jgi:hypothetical protein